MTHESIPPDDKDGVNFNQIMAMLRTRIESRKKSDIVAYFELLFPELEAPPDQPLALHEFRTEYHAEEFLVFHDTQFVELAYRCILKRGVDADGRHSALQSIRKNPYSRLLLLGALCKSEEGLERAVTVHGLKERHFLARLSGAPVLGKLLVPFLNLDELLKLDGSLRRRELVAEQQSAQLGRIKQLLAEHETSVPGTSALPEVQSQTALTVPATRDYYREIPPNTLPTYLSLLEEEFVVAAARFIVNRNLSADEVASESDKLRAADSSRARYLQQLCQSPDAVVGIDSIVGLRNALAGDRWSNVPVLGWLLRLPRALRNLAKLNREMATTERSLAESVRRQYLLEREVVTDYNKLVRNLKSELIQAVNKDSTGES